MNDDHNSSEEDDTQTDECERCGVRATCDNSHTCLRCRVELDHIIDVWLRDGE